MHSLQGETVLNPFLLPHSKNILNLYKLFSLFPCIRFLGQPPGGSGQGEPRITGPMMAQYLLALLGNRDPMSALLAASLGAPGMPESGRMGDYVFNQEGLSYETIYGYRS